MLPSLQTIVVAVAVGFRLPQQSDAHIFFQCPPARTCFYGGTTPETDGDGPWRRTPCDRAPVIPTVTVAAGQVLCLALHEFVPHPGHYSIHLADIPIGPEDPEPDWVMLMNSTAQATDGATTALQRFSVKVPESVRSQHATIQVKQWAADFSWYYYACTDIKIVANASEVPEGSDTCWDRGSEQCVLEGAPPRLRIMIMQTVVYGTLGLVFFAALGAWARVVHRRSQSKSATPKDLDGEREDVEMVGSVSANASALPAFRATAASYKRSLIIISVLFVLAILVAYFILENLKSCSS